jgi:hypothetical protein
MDWSQQLHRTLTLVTTTFALVGCGAVMSAPITLSIWVIWLLVALARPAARGSWYGYTFIIAVQLLCGALVGLAGAIDPNQSTKDAGLGIGFFLLCLLLSAGAVQIWSQSPNAPAQRGRIFNIILAGLLLVGGAVSIWRFVIA